MKSLFAAVLASALLFQSCANEPSGPAGDNGRVVFQTQMENSGTISLVSKGDGASAILAKGQTVDSLHISQVRILISRIKLRRAVSDTNAGDRDVKLAPVALIFDSAGVRTVMNELVPAGTYDRVKFEFHKPSGNEENQFRNDTNFREFVDGGRYTFVISGTLFDNGQSSPFTYRSDVNANLSLRLDPSISVGADSTQTILLSILPRPAFKDGSDVLDPRDPENESHIDNAIKDAIRALKKNP